MSLTVLSPTICRRKPALSLTGLGAVGVRSGGEARYQETVRDADAKMAPIESIGELLEMEWATGASAPVKRAVNHRFGIAYGGSNPPEHMRGPGIVTKRDCVVRVMNFGWGGVACPSHRCAKRPKAPPGGLIPRQWSHS